MTQDVELVGRLDANFAWNGAELYAESHFGGDISALVPLRGAAAGVHQRPDGGWRLLRDPLGINKLFWVQDETGQHRWGWASDETDEDPPRSRHALPPLQVFPA